MNPIARTADHGKEIREFWWRVWSAMQRIAAFALFAIAHRAASALVEWAIPDGWNEAINFSKGIGVLFLVLVEFFLGWDMLAVFWPRLQMKSDEISI